MADKKRISFAKKLTVILLLCIATLNIFTAAVSYMGLRSELNWLPCAFMTVDGGSMEPELEIGDLIFVWRTPFDELEIGDVVTVYQNEEFVTHKVVRIEDGNIVTKGTVFDAEDTPSGESQYYAKMLFSIPKAGTAFKVITSIPVTAVLVILVVVILYGKTFLTFIAGRRNKKTGPVRAALAVFLASVMIIPSVLTSARYSAYLDKATAAVANEILFTSNFLSTEGNSYKIAGWSGETYTVALKINNYCNALRYNHEDVDLDYKITVDKIDTEGTTTYKTNEYSITTTWADSTKTPDANGYYTITGEDSGGKFDSINILIDARPGSGYGTNLQDGDKIKFKITAETKTDSKYYQKITGEFEFEVTAATRFLGSRIITQSTGSSLVKYEITSNVVSGTTSRKIVIMWDANLLYLNTEQTMVWNLINNDTSSTTYVREDPNTHIGSLTFTMSSYSSMTFEFFKKSSKLNTAVKETYTEIPASGSEAAYDQLYLHELGS